MNMHGLNRDDSPALAHLHIGPTNKESIGFPSHSISKPSRALRVTKRVRPQPAARGPSVTATFRRKDGRSLHVRKATRAEPEQQEIYRALGIDPALEASGK